jgi:dTDP-glucose pyrophosphorylase/CBS domain-containing protein
MKVLSQDSKVFWRKAEIALTSSLQDAARNLSASSLRICLVVDVAGKLVGTISDGDIRRGLLRGLQLSSSVAEITNRSPLVVPFGIGPDTVRRMMSANNIYQIPEIGPHGEVIDLHLWDHLVSERSTEAVMVVMAGGKGTRLRPYTDNCPKPMLLVKGKPMMAHIVDQARLEGFSKVVVSINYLGHLVEEYFGNGRRFGVDIEYIREAKALGTAGALSLMTKTPDSPFVVTNGDVITDIRYGDIIDFHKRHDAVATMAVRLHEWQHPFGVVELNGLEISGFEEKPIARSHINAGVYVLSPGCLSLLEKNEQCDMPELFERVRRGGGRVVAFPMHEPWLDVGRPQDLSIVNNEE